MYERLKMWFWSDKSEEHWTVIRSIPSQYVGIGILWLFVGSALIGMILGYAEWFLPKTPLNLTISLVVIMYCVSISKKAMIVLFAIMLMGYLAEVAGVHTGQIFGQYYYGENLGIKVFEVPLMIGVFWGILTMVTNQIARDWSDKRWVVSLTGAGLMVWLDLLMEQLASDYDFWHFDGGLAGIQNYIAWFALAYGFQYLIYPYLTMKGRRVSIHLFLSQFAFFWVGYLIFRT
ncbi:MAG: carotenoid biosynthesis protein [Bacteroidota bacterium]